MRGEWRGPAVCLGYAHPLGECTPHFLTPCHRFSLGNARRGWYKHDAHWQHHLLGTFQFTEPSTYSITPLTSRRVHGGTEHDEFLLRSGGMLFGHSPPVQAKTFHANFPGHVHGPGYSVKGGQNECLTESGFFLAIFLRPRVSHSHDTSQFYSIKTSGLLPEPGNAAMCA